MTKYEYDAVIVGSGPNGFAAGIKLIQAGLSVLIIEAKKTIGGGMRSAELTLPGFIHDICSSIHPLGVASPFFKTLPLHEHGLKWIFPPAALAHPLENGSFALLQKSLEDTAVTLGSDGSKYKKIIEPIVNNWEKLVDFILGPLTIPEHPIALAEFGLVGIQPLNFFAKSSFDNEEARCLFAGIAGHAMIPLNKPLTTSFGILLASLAHIAGWPMPEGGTQNLANALQSYFVSLGGNILTNTPVTSIKEIPSAKAIIFDLSPKEILKIVGNKFPDSYTKELENYRYGQGVFKIDWALDAPIPFTVTECSKAGTVHLGGSLDEIIESEKLIWEGKHSDTPLVLLAQHSLFDQSRAPSGKHTGWAYCHVPHGSTEDMTQIIEKQVERFAPGFRERILARHTMNTVQMETYNSNYVGGDINGGVQDIWQFYNRPALRLSPYSTPLDNIYICSSATPPGGGVHGMCGLHAAEKVLKDHFS